MAAGFEGLHCGCVVIAAVFIPARGYAYHIGFAFFKHFLNIVKGGDAQALCGRIGAGFVNVAYAYEFGQWIFNINISVPVANWPQPDDAYT